MQKYQNGIENYNNLGMVLQAISKINDKGITFLGIDMKEKFVTYKGIYEKSLQILYGLQKNGLQAGDELIFQIESTEKFVYVFWACMLGGVIPVPIPVGNSIEDKMKVFRIWSILKRPYLISEQNILESIEEFVSKYVIKGLDEIRTKYVYYSNISELSEEGEISRRSKDDLAFIQFSSGSTGEPKGVLLTHKNLVSNVNAILNGIDCTSEDSCLCWMPLTHDMGLIGLHICALAAGINQILMPTVLFIRNPVIWMDKVNEHKITLLGSPNFGFKHFLVNFSRENTKNWDLSRVRLIINGAEPISVELCNKFLDCLSVYGLKRNTILPVYGLAEATVVVSYPPYTDELAVECLDRNSICIGEKAKFVNQDENNVTFVNLGYPIKDCEARICDSNNIPVNDLIVGYLQVRGKSVTSGYYGRQSISDLFTEDGWLNTGDVGFMDHGRLTITGRSKDIIFMNGKNYYPYDIEKVIENAGFVFEGIAATSYYDKKRNSEELIIFICMDADSEEFDLASASIKNLVYQRVGINSKYIIPVKQLPRTVSGKIQRYKLREMFENGEFNEIITNISSRRISNKVEKKVYSDIENKLLVICREVFGTDEIDICENFMELGGNSMILTQIHCELDELYPGKVEVVDLFTYPTIEKLAQHIAKSMDLEIKAVVFPEEYLVSKTEENRQFFNISLDGDELECIKSIVGMEQVHVKYVLLSVFIYLVSELTECQEIPLMIAEDSEKTTMLKFDITDISDFNTLLQAISRQYEERKSGNTNIETLIKFVSLKQKNEILLAFGEIKDGCQDNCNIPDLLMEVEESEKTVNVKFHYNNALLSGAGMKRFQNYYIKTVEGIRNQYDIEEEGMNNV